MEHLTSFQLERYDDIIKKIEDEHNRRTKLTKQIQTLDNKIIATGLMLKKDTVKDKVFKVLVKIMNSVFDIYDQLSDKISEHEIGKLSSYIDGKYYFIEVYVSKSFQERIIQKDWVISALVKNSDNQINKSVSLNKKVRNPICLVIPFENTIKEATIEVDVAWPGNSKWPSLKIASIAIDVSYHLHLYSDLKIKNNFSFNVIGLSKLYGFQSVNSKLPILKCEMACHSDFDKFLKVLIENSYHNWDPRKDSCFSKTEYTAIAKTTAGLGNIITVELNVATNSLTLHGNAEELFYLKNYFLTAFHQETYEMKRDVNKTIEDVTQNLQNNSESINVLINIYNEINRIII